MPSTFPLLRLPMVALRVIINSFHLNHLVSLSFCSQRTRKIIKILRTKQRNIEIHLVFCSYARVDLVYDFTNGFMPLENLHLIEYSSISIEHEVSEERKIERTRSGNNIIPVTKSINEKGEIDLEFRCSDRFVGIKIVAEYLTSFFENPIHGLCLSSEMFPEQVRRTIEWTLCHQKSIELCYIEDDVITDDEIRSVLDISNSLTDFYIDSKPSPDFEHQFVFENGMIDVSNAHWFNINNLIKMNCRRCRIGGSKLTNGDMNQFLKLWKTGTFPKMKVVDIQMEDIDLEVLLADLDAAEVPDGVQRKFINENNEEETITFGFDIQCQEGRTATIVHEGGIIISKEFFMIVW